MLELPEGIILARQLNASVLSKRVAQVLPPTKHHSFCWFNGDVGAYDEKLRGATVTGATSAGMFAELLFDNGQRLCVSDGTSVRLVQKPPKTYQLYVALEGGECGLSFNVAMYGGIVLHANDYDNEYYSRSMTAISVLSPSFPDVFCEELERVKPSMSLKAFLATEQRFPGIGNGTLQDILFNARLNPRADVGALSDADKKRLLRAVIATVKETIEGGGRDTERDLYGNYGGYRTLMSKNTYKTGCPACGRPITKETYLGGSVYYCQACQRRH